MALLKDPTITQIVVEHKDRLTGFGFRYLETLLELQGRTIEVTNLAENDREDLLADLVSIVYSFATRLYGPRRAKRKTEAIVKQLKVEEDTERLNQHRYSTRGEAMRKLLKQQEGRRGEFRGTVAQFGTKRAFRGPDLPTMLLRDVEDETGQIVTDHVWMTVGKQLSRLNVQVGEEVVFVARVTRYERGYKGSREDVFAAPPSTDYRLSYPTNVRRVETRQHQSRVENRLKGRQTTYATG